VAAAACVGAGAAGGGGQEARFQLGSLASQRRARPQGGGSGAEPTANAGQRKRSGAYDERMRRNKRYFLFGKTVPEWFFLFGKTVPGRTDGRPHRIIIVQKGEIKFHGFMEHFFHAWLKVFS
jgi:hypothetical protein